MQKKLIITPYHTDFVWTYFAHMRRKIPQQAVCASILVGMMGINMSGCVSQPSGILDNRNMPNVVINHQGVPNRYRVKAGDTVSQIAQRYGLNYRQIGAMNGLDSRYTIHVGQWLTLWQQGQKKQRGQKTQTGNNIYAPVYSDSSSGVPALHRSNTLSQTFTYPSANRVIRNFAPSTNTIGMWFDGQRGDAVRASQTGVVMYAGSELEEYGNLVMIEHEQHYITAYAHLDQILVSEGETVTRGQRIGKMGNTGSQSLGQVALEFQVRRNGTPIDPRAVLRLQ